MKQTPERDEELETLAYDVIASIDDLFDVRASEARIAVVKSFTAKKSEGRLVFADIRPVQDIYKALVPFDYIITVYAKNTCLLSDEQMRVLMWHELLHVKISHNKDGVVFGTKGHDIEDFYDIINAYGMDWSIKDIDAKKTDESIKPRQPKKGQNSSRPNKGRKKGNSN